jgi:hypothetical protein
MATIRKAIPKAQNGKLTKAELDALSHQKRGMGTLGSSYVKKRGLMNDLGHLTSAQQDQLKTYMSKAGTAKKIYEGSPNVGTIFGSSAANIPKGSQLENQRRGGVIKKAQNGITKYSDPKPLFDKIEKTKDSISTARKKLDATKAIKDKALKSNMNKIKTMKMKNGGSLSALSASNKRDNGIDPKGAFTKVQKKTLAGARGKASLTKDKQLGATKMAKRGMSIKKK